MKIHPLHNNVLVKRNKTEEKTLGGIIIPHTAHEKSQEAEVLAVGPGRFTDNGAHINMDIKAGDVVLIEKGCGVELKLDGEEFFLVRYDDIIAVLERGFIKHG